MSDLTLKRHTFTDLSTIGDLYLDGAFECHSLEPRRTQANGKPYCIPPGTYQFVIAFSPKHQRDLPLLLNVPGFVGVEMHIGNRPQDTLGCILVGDTIGPGPDFISQSTVEFDRLFPKLTPGSIEIQDTDPITVTDPDI
jgi:hypothetical protein